MKKRRHSPRGPEPRASARRSTRSLGVASLPSRDCQYCDDRAQFMSAFYTDFTVTLRELARR